MNTMNEKENEIRTGREIIYGNKMKKNHWRRGWSEFWKRNTLKVISPNGRQ